MKWRSQNNEDQLNEIRSNKIAITRIMKLKSAMWKQVTKLTVPTGVIYGRTCCFNWRLMRVFPVSSDFNL